jgi:hypothetical protein
MLREDIVLPVKGEAEEDFYRAEWDLPQGREAYGISKTQLLSLFVF